MKILKKVISAVIAMAIAGSMIPASLAAKVELTDVADTASYATAVKTLVALDIINGYEDDTFRPDNEITRAEAAKVVVAALNMTEVANGKPGATGFVDVADDFWANGFINVGVDEDIINGREGNTFAPAANVTIAEMAKMLVVALGYEEYAQYLGGWSKGYMKIADDEGITAGISGNNNDPATRAQVAQMVYNALNTPIVVNTGLEYSDNGKLVPTIAKQDGKKTDVSYKTLLTEKFDAYLVEAYVLETPKSDSTLENDEVELAVAKAQKYDRTDALKQTAVVTNLTAADVTARQLRPVAVGETAAADYLGVYGIAIVAVNEFEEYELIDFQPSGKNKTLTFKAADIEANETAFNGTTDGDDVIAVYESETAANAKEYKLDENLKIYVNGVAVTSNTANFNKFVVNNTTATVELVDTYRVDGKYDTIYVDYYATAQVASLVASSKQVNLRGASALVLDEEDESLTFHIYYNGEEIKFADLAKEDVVSIAYNVGADGNAAVDASAFLDIYVSRDVKTGKLTKIDDVDYTFGGEVYNFVSSAPDGLTVSKEYTLALDYFGNIYSCELNTSVVKYAVVEKVKFDEADQTYDVTLFTSEGTTKTYSIDKNTLVNENTSLTSVGTKGAALETATYVNPAANPRVKKSIHSRVVEYTLNATTGNIKEIKVITAAQAAGTVNTDGSLGTDPVEFDAAKARIGSVRMNDATKVVDAIKYQDNYNTDPETAETASLVIASKDDLSNGTDYIALAYGTKASDNTYPLVLVLKGEAGYGLDDTRFAVVTGAASTILDEETDTTVKAIEVLYKGEKVTLSFNSSVNATVDALKKGDVILFQNGADGLVNQVDLIFTTAIDTDPSTEGNQAVLDSKASLTAASLVSSLTNITIANPSADAENFATVGSWGNSDKIEIVYGPVMEVTSSYISIGKVYNGDPDGATIPAVGETPAQNTEPVQLYTDMSKDESDNAGCYAVNVTDATSAYIWNFKTANADKNLTIGDATALQATIPSELEGLTINDGDIILWNKEANSAKPNQNDVNYALALVVDGDVVDVLAFENK